MNAYGSIKILDEKNKLNDKLGEEISAAKKSFDTCFENYFAFRVKIRPQVLELTEQLKNEVATPLKDEEIRAAFDEAVNTAKIELNVTAMKLNNYIADKYIPQLKKLLKAGVQIKILYGIGEEDSDENFWTKKIADKLKKIFRNYPKFKMKRTDTHAKIFICNNKFFVLSSYNVLSKDGERYSFGEAGIRSGNAELISHYRKEYFNF